MNQSTMLGFDLFNILNISGKFHTYFLELLSMLMIDSSESEQKTKFQ